MNYYPPARGSVPTSNAPMNTAWNFMTPAEALRREYFAAHPSAGFENIFGPQMGNNRNSPYAKFIASLFDTFQNQYQGIAPDQPDLSSYDYFQQQRGVPQSMWANFAPSQRGEHAPPQLQWKSLFGSR